jgi:hypothetical protein
MKIKVIKELDFNLGALREAVSYKVEKQRLTIKTIRLMKVKI